MKEAEDALFKYILARNALRSAIVAAHGQGPRSKAANNLRIERIVHDKALRAIAGWVETKAREELKHRPTPEFDTAKYGEVE